MTDLPTPFTPSDCDLTGMAFMPLEVSRLMQSTLFAKSTGDEFKAAVALWCASWNEKPAASLPNDDEMLAYLSRAKNWKKVKARAMHGWVLCSDGRLYHETVANNAIDAWDRRKGYQEVSNNKTERQKRWRERCRQLSDQLRELGITPPSGASLETLEQMLEKANANGKASTGASTRTSTDESTVDDCETGKTGTVKDRDSKGQYLKPTVPIGTGANAPPEGLTAKEAVFQIAVPWLVANGSKEGNVRSLLGGAMKQLGEQGAWELASECMREQPIEPISWLAAALNARIAKLKGDGKGKAGTLAEQQQASTEEARRLLFGQQGEVIDGTA